MQALSVATATELTLPTWTTEVTLAHHEGSGSTMYLLLILRPVRVRRDLPIVPVIVHIIILLIFRVDKGSNCSLLHILVGIILTSQNDENPIHLRFFVMWTLHIPGSLWAIIKDFGTRKKTYGNRRHETATDKGDSLAYGEPGQEHRRQGGDNYRDNGYGDESSSDEESQYDREGYCHRVDQSDDESHGYQDSYFDDEDEEDPDQYASDGGFDEDGEPDDGFDDDDDDDDY
ncbi:hypothetical protein F4823DRAFT_559144 [Ustulina deusta]|nr:hypothetical protein F4823DRAFT_559144 [Ustulina deusta]